MAMDVEAKRKGRWWPSNRSTPIALPSPVWVLAFALGFCALLASLPLTLPVGAMYWDLVVYLDGAQRVATGQMPAVDFFAPVGPLGYWLLAAAMSVFTGGQPLLLADWSVLAFMAPAMALVMADVSRRSRAIALALLLPWLFLQLLPMNVEQYSTFPSVDGYGIYNRQTTGILFVLTAALMFCRSQRLMMGAVTWCMVSLFLLKITGFLSGGLLCALALATGRIRWSTALGVAALFAVVLGGLELWSGVVSAYVADILLLVEMNTHSLAPRFVQAASIHFGIFAPGVALVLALLAAGWPALAQDSKDLRARPTMVFAARLLDRPAVWLAAGLFAGLFFETQNTGSQAFSFIWPMLLAALGDARRLSGGRALLIAALVAAAALPPAVNMTHRLSRALVGQIQYATLSAPLLGTLGQASQRPESLERAALLRRLYIDQRDTFVEAASLGILPTYSLYSEIDFQVGWLLSIEEAAEAILAYEAENDVRFETILNLNFANPFPLVLDRRGPLHVAIGADPFRAIPPPDDETLAAIADTDLILYPTCPVTIANDRIADLYRPALAGRTAVELSPCWIGYLKS